MRALLYAPRTTDAIPLEARSGTFVARAAELALLPHVSLLPKAWRRENYQQGGQRQTLMMEATINRLTKGEPCDAPRSEPNITQLSFLLGFLMVRFEQNNIRASGRADFFTNVNALNVDIHMEIHLKLNSIVTSMQTPVF